VIENKGKFFHPFMQTILMFVGETLIGFVYLFERSKKGKQESSG
jgi:predicted nucleic-acid-binding protein